MSFMMVNRIRSVYLIIALTAVLAITFASCGKGNSKQEQVSVFGIVDNAQYGETHAFSEWHGRYWEVFGNPGDSKFTAMTSRISTTSFDSIKQEIDEEFGPCEYSKANMPKDLVSEDGFYWHLSKPSCDDVYYWSNDTLVIAWVSYPEIGLLIKR